MLKYRHDVQTLALFGALTFSSLYFVLAWTTLAPPVLEWCIPSRPGSSRCVLQISP